MLNNELMAQSARTWAQKLASISDPGQRIVTLFETAFNRPHESWEQQEALTFVSKQQATLGAKPDAAEAAWADLCHVIMNSPEFIYVR